MRPSAVAHVEMPGSMSVYRTYDMSRYPPMPCCRCAGASAEGSYVAAQPPPEQRCQHSPSPSTAQTAAQERAKCLPRNIFT